MEPPKGKNQITTPQISFLVRLQSCLSKLMMAAMARIMYRTPNMERLPLFLYALQAEKSSVRGSKSAIRGKREVK